MRKFLHSAIASLAQKNIYHRLILVFLFLFIAVFILIGFKSRAHSFYFQDETDHVTMGWMMWKFDRQLYSDLSTNHMPVPIYLGAFLTKIINFGTLYELIWRLRQAMWLIWVVYGAWAVWRFRSAGAIAFTFLMTLGFYYFGFHVLTDPLGAMNVAILMLYAGEAFISQKKLSLIDGALIGICAVLAWFSVLALWPFILVTVGWHLVLADNRVRKGILLSLVVATALIFILINPLDWWREAVSNNINYVIHDQANFTMWEKVGIVLYPVSWLFNPQSQQAMSVFGLFLLLAWLWWQWLKKSSLPQRQKIIFSLIFLGLLASLNTRTPNAALIFYRGIHSLPILAGMMALIGSFYAFLLRYFTPETKKRLIVFILFLLIIVGRFMKEDINQLDDYYIQYGNFESIGKALKQITKPGDTLATMPDGYGYINQVAEIPIFGKQNFHLSWSFYVPYLHDYFFDLFENQPPTFIFARPGGDPHYQAIMPDLKSRYVRLKRQYEGNDLTMFELFMLKSALKSVTPAQWTGFQNLGFVIPPEYYE